MKIIIFIKQFFFNYLTDFQKKYRCFVKSLNIHELLTVFCITLIRVNKKIKYLKKQQGKVVKNKKVTIKKLSTVPITKKFSSVFKNYFYGEIIYCPLCPSLSSLITFF